MSNDTKNTDDLIGQLCEGLEPSKLACAYKRIVPWFLLSVIYLVGTVLFLGLRPDISERLIDGVFLFEMGLASMIFITAGMTSSWLSFPDSHQKEWMKAVTVTLFAVFALWVTTRSIEEGLNLSTTLHLGHCAHEGIIMEVVPIIVLIFITMRGHTVQPFWSMTMNVLAVSALGWLGLRMTCSMDQMGHSFFNHLLPFAIIGAGLGFFARKLFKW